jgi:hypothetical protein
MEWVGVALCGGVALVLVLAVQTLVMQYIAFNFAGSPLDFGVALACVLGGNLLASASSCLVSVAGGGAGSVLGAPASFAGYTLAVMFIAKIDLVPSAMIALGVSIANALLAVVLVFGTVVVMMSLA